MRSNLRAGLGVGWPRTKGPYEPDWIRLVRRGYYQHRDVLNPVVWRIGRTDSGRDFLRRTGAYGLENL